MTESFSISFIIPVYNEEYNIINVLKDLYAVIDEHPEWNSEVIVIEDGSTDRTRDIVKEEVKKYSDCSLILHERNQGYTRSLKDGIERSQGRFLMYIGADEEFDCSEVPHFVSPLMNGQADIVLGVRWQRNAYKLFRFFLSVIYIFLLNYLFKLRVNDYNWSQAWCRDLLDEIDIRAKSLFVLPEIIVKGFDLGYRVKEVPSNHRGRRRGKSSVNMRIMGHALWDALKFWSYRRSKKYQSSSNISAGSKRVTV